MATNLTSSSVSAGDDATAAQYNNLRTDVLVNAGDYETAAGSSNAYTLSIDSSISAYAAGQKFRFQANHTNTGAATLNVNSIGAKTIKKKNGQDLLSGDIESGQEVEVVYDGTYMQMISNPSSVTTKFGGDGSDGALDVSSGTTNIDLGNAAVVVKNYTYISITGTGKVTFSNPHTDGTIIILKSQGNVTLTSSQAPMLDASGMGQQFASTAKLGFETDTNFRATTAPTAGSQYTSGFDLSLYTTSSDDLYQRVIHVFPSPAGDGGGNGSAGAGGGAGGTGGDGGAGGPALIIECGGAWNFTTTNGISVAGGDGSNGTNGDDLGDSNAAGSGGGGGSGGCGGTFVGLYNELTANTGTVNISSGIGGDGGDSAAGVTPAGGPPVGGHGAGTSGNLISAGQTGTTGDNDGGANGTNSAGGAGAGVDASHNTYTGGTGGSPDTSSGLSIITENIWF